MRLALALGAATAVFAAGAGAQEFPTLKGEVEVRIQNDYTYRSKDKSQKLNDTFTKTEMEVELGLTPELSFRSTLKLEPVRSANKDRFFGDHGLWLEELLVNYETDDFSVFAGKFNPKFGSAFEKAPFIFGRDFVEDYETTEKIGFGGSIKLAPEGWGEHALTGAVYFQDTTVLSNSIFSRPRFDDPRTERVRRNRKRFGGVSNTGSLESFALSLDGEAPGALKGLEYTVGYRYQKGGLNDELNEKGFVAGLTYEWVITEDIHLHPLVEYADFKNFDGANLDARYLTGALLLEYGAWSASTSVTSRRLKFRGEESSTDKDLLYQVSLGYHFEFGLGVYVGWKHQKVEGITSNTLGLMALYGFEF